MRSENRLAIIIIIKEQAFEGLVEISVFIMAEREALNLRASGISVTNYVDSVNTTASAFSLRVKVFSEMYLIGK
jgi:hypothetical protein